MVTAKKNICLIGAGNIGSRHLQALKKTQIPLNIYVVDPSKKSLKTAKDRYEEFPSSKRYHHVFYQTKLEKLPKFIDVAIIATNSDVRKEIIKSLLSVAKVKYLLLEKILFQMASHYQEVERLLKGHHCRAWVNCSRREMPFYFKLKESFKNEKIHYIVTGGQYGLASNSIHYIDHMALLTNCYDYTVNTTHLNTKPIKSKRKGFLELNGTLLILFKNGSVGIITSYPKYNAPCIVSIYSPKTTYIINETEKEALSTNFNDKWHWKKENISIPYQSELTNKIIEQILIKGKCNLTPYTKSSKLHLILLNSLLGYLKKNYDNKMNYYPFT